MKHTEFSDMDFLDTSAEDVTEEQILDYLARIISSIYLKERATQQHTEEDSALLVDPA